MIKVIYGDSRSLLGGSTFSHFFEKMSDTAKQRIMEPKRKDHRAYRLMTYLMLDALYRRELGAPLPELCFADHGKPYIENGPAFNVSHDAGYVAIAMTKDFKDVGIDITPAYPFGTPSTFVCDYVRAEAIMKMTGGGFSDYPRLRDLCAECQTALVPLGEIAIGLAYR